MHLYAHEYMHKYALGEKPVVPVQGGHVCAQNPCRERDRRNKVWQSNVPSERMGTREVMAGVSSRKMGNALFLY